MGVLLLVASAGCSQAAPAATKIPAAVDGPPSPAAAGPDLEGVGLVSELPTTSSTTLVAEATELSPQPVTEDGPEPSRVGPGVGNQTALPPPEPRVPPTWEPAAGDLTTVSWYGSESGSTTANGEHFDPDGLTFAHKTMVLGSVVEFCRGGACVVATCTDRGPFIAGRDFDLSRGAFAAIAPLSAGVVDVTWRAA